MARSARADTKSGRAAGRKLSASVSSGSKRRTVAGRGNRRKSDKRRSPARAVEAFMDGGRAFAYSGPFLQRIPWNLVRFISGLALIPVLWVTVESFFMSFAHAARTGSFWRTEEFWFFMLGMIGWLVLFFGLRGRPMMWLYVAGHELTHAVFVLICGGNVKKLRITSEGGHVVTNKNNILISLSPYFVPFYSVIVIAVWWLLERFVFHFNAGHDWILFGAIGLTWSFHLSFTVWMIAREQPDLQQNGVFFSLMLIGLINALTISGMLIVASPTLSASYYTHTWVHNLYTFGARLVESVQEIVAFFV